MHNFDRKFKKSQVFLFLFFKIVLSIRTLDQFTLAQPIDQPDTAEFYWCP
jgi:hypothetical protein